MAKQEIVIIKCDVCGTANADSFDNVMVIADGSEYEYGVNRYDETKPTKERLCFHQLDLCNDCQKTLMQKQLHFIHGFHRRGDYFFEK